MNSYKGYDAEVVYDSDTRTLHGSVPNIRGVITFVADNVDQLEREFHISVDMYLELCAEHGIEPAKPYSGNFVVRIDPKLHAAIAQAARNSEVSLNSWVCTTLAAGLEAQAITADTAI